MPSLPFVIGLDGAKLPVVVSPPLDYLTSKIELITKIAMIDTGATLSVISDRLRDSWRLPPSGVEVCNRPGGDLSWLDTYFVRLQLGGNTDSSRWFELEVFALDPGTADVDVIIGMDLLVQLNMNWSGKRGNGTLSFKEP